MTIYIFDVLMLHNTEKIIQCMYVIQSEIKGWDDSAEDLRSSIFNRLGSNPVSL